MAAFCKVQLQIWINFPGFGTIFVATRLSCDHGRAYARVLNAYVMHAHYDVLLTVLCMSALRNKKTEFVFIIYLHKEDERPELTKLRTED